MSPLQLLARAVPFIAGVFVFGACGGGESSPVVASVSDWCLLYSEPLPALSSPNPDGQEIETLDTYIDRYSLLSDGATGVSQDLIDGAERFRISIEGVRDKVSEGASLQSVLAEEFGQNGELVTSGEALQATADGVC